VEKWKSGEGVRHSLYVLYSTNKHVDETTVELDRRTIHGFV
jgi:hypothetical protein